MTTLNARANRAWLELAQEHGMHPHDNERITFEEGWERGFRACTDDQLGLLRILRAEAITSERKSAYDRAIEAVEGLS